MAIPSFESLLKLSREGNEELFHMKRSLRSNISKIFLFILSLILVYVVNYAIKDPQSVPVIFRFISPRWLGLIPCGILLLIAQQNYNTLYVFTLNNITRIDGRVAFSLDIPSVKYVDIKGIIVSQDIWGRIFGYGSVFIGTAAQDQTELTLDNIDNPYQVARLIEKFRDYAISQEGVSVRANRD